MELRMVGRVGVTLAPLRPTILGSPDVAVSGYPQIYPHKTAEQNGIATRQNTARRLIAYLPLPPADVVISQHRNDGISVASGCPCTLLADQIITRSSGSPHQSINRLIAGPQGRLNRHDTFVAAFRLH